MTSEFQDGSHDIIYGRKVLPLGECTPSICPAHMQQRSPVPNPQYEYTFVLFTEIPGLFSIYVED